MNGGRRRWRADSAARRRRGAAAWALSAIAVTGMLIAAAAQAQPPPDLSRANWQQRLGQSLPLQLRFADERGHVAALASYFGKRPVALILMYLSCSQLCPLTMAMTQQAFQSAGLVPGRDFELLAVSIDPFDRPAAAARRELQWARDEQWRRGLHILTAAALGSAPGSDPGAQLAAAAGFGYIYDPHSRQYGHPAGWVLADAQGHISRYFFGVRYDPVALREAVRNAAADGRPTWSQPLRLLCYCLTVLTGRYDGVILDALRAACVAIVLLGAGLLWRGMRRSRPLGSS